MPLEIDDSAPDDFVHGFCLDCGKQFSDKWMHNNPFATAGEAPTCNLCGGVVAVMDERRASSIIEKEQRKRGIARETRATMGDWDKSGESYTP